MVLLIRIRKARIKIIHLIFSGLLFLSLIQNIEISYNSNSSMEIIDFDNEQITPYIIEYYLDSIPNFGTDLLIISISCENFRTTFDIFNEITLITPKFSTDLWFDRRWPRDSAIPRQVPRVSIPSPQQPGWLRHRP